MYRIDGFAHAWPPRVTPRPLMTVASLSRALAAVVYVSEGRRTVVLDAIERVARDASLKNRVALVNVFVDREYNRTGFTLAGAHTDGIANTALDIAKKSLELIDFSTHDATHPRLGVVDHVSCHELRGERDAGAALARNIGRGLGDQGVPVKLYGDAASDKVGLAEIRRRAGYFSGSKEGRWMGDGGLRELALEYGPSEMSSKIGFGCVGAVPWVCNYNVPLTFAFDAGVDADERMRRALAFGRAAAKCVSERGGGLPSVQSMALPHGDRVEVACNLLDMDVTSTADVQRATESTVASINAWDYLGVGSTVRVDQGYVTNQTPESMLEAIAALERGN